MIVGPSLSDFVHCRLDTAPTKTVVDALVAVVFRRDTVVCFPLQSQKWFCTLHDSVQKGTYMPQRSAPLLGCTLTGECGGVC